MTTALRRSTSADVRAKQLEDEIRERHAAVTCAFLQVLDLRDIDTGVHSTRLAEWGVRVAERMGVSDDKLADVETAALLHDLGKVGISDAVLHKPGPVTPTEMEELRRHPEYGWTVLRSVPGFETVALYILHHHERFDGTGYPAGIGGDRIPLGARIVAVIDAFDAMVSQRPYRPTVPFEEALRRLHESAGTQFDPAIVQEFTRLAAAEPRFIDAALQPSETFG